MDWSSQIGYNVWTEGDCTESSFDENYCLKEPIMVGGETTAKISWIVKQKTYSCSM